MSRQGQRNSMFLLFVDVEEFFQKVVKDFQRVDVLVNNAGITRDAFLMRMSEEQWGSDTSG